MLQIEFGWLTLCFFVFFFKQKTAYEMRSSDWSSDVCSSDLYLCTHMRDLVSKAVVSPLSKREREVIRLLAQGLTVTEIAQRICRSVKTVSCHKANAMRKLGIHTHSQLFVYARSEEHTSELQSLMRISYAVFCLKKKTNK